jgi:hypothetical protein
MPVPDPVKIFHITHGENLPSIIETGALMSKSESTDISTTSVAYEDIQDRRAATQVTIGPKGILHDYVPCYFAPRSPMLFAVHSGDAGGQSDQRAIIHLVSTVNEIEHHACEFIFTDGHAIMNLSEFFEDPSQLTHVDWNVMSSEYWNDTDKDPDRKRRRQAEFLVHQKLPWTAIQRIGVVSDEIADRVREIMERCDASHRPKVLTKPEWYY